MRRIVHELKEDPDTAIEIYISRLVQLDLWDLFLMLWQDRFLRKGSGSI